MSSLYFLHRSNFASNFPFENCDQNLTAEQIQHKDYYQDFEDLFPTSKFIWKTINLEKLLTSSFVFSLGSSGSLTSVSWAGSSWFLVSSSFASSAILDRQGRLPFVKPNLKLQLFFVFSPFHFWVFDFEDKSRQNEPIKAILKHVTTGFTLFGKNPFQCNVFSNLMPNVLSHFNFYRVILCFFFRNFFVFTFFEDSKFLLGGKNSFFLDFFGA